MAIQPGIDVGRYHILERLGEGGMAIVYQAQDKDLSKIVAIKTLRIERLIPAYRDKSLKRFQIEIRQMAKLDHPNIIPILDSGNYEDIPFLVMPFITSGSLKQRIKSHFSWQEAANIVIQLADALGYAHRKNIIHRDVKPSNVLMDESGNPLLADFGIAKVFDNPETIDLTTTMMGIGTPEYMAPELATSRIFDYRVDIYSLGVLFYELLTGRKPFIADTPAAVLIKHATDPLPNPTQFNPDIPREIEDILGKSLAKKPQDRFQTAEDLANSLRDFSGLSPAPELQPVVHKSVSPAIPIISLIGIIGIVVGFGINNNMSKANVSVNDLALATEKDEDQITSPIGVVSSTSNIGSSPQITEIKTISTCEDKAEFVKETIIDGTIFQAGADFTKTWTIKNSGDCVWGSDYALVYEEGDLLSGPDFVSLPHVVNPGESITLEVQLKAPFQSGFYSCYWIFKSDQGENLTRLYVKISIPGAQTPRKKRYP